MKNEQLLGNNCYVITKGTTPTTIGGKFADSGIPFVRAQNIADGTVSFDDDALYIDNATHTLLKRSVIKAGDVLIAIAGTIGRVGVVPAGLGELNCNQAVAIIRVKDTIDNNYLKHWLQSSAAVKQIKSSTVVGVISNLSLSQISNLKISLPPLAEQKRIAAILDKATAIKAKREKAIAKLDELAQSRYAEMFGNHPNSVETTLGECLRLINGRAYLQHELLDEGTPIIRIQNLNGGNRWYYSNLDLPYDKHCENGDLLFAWSATFGPYIWSGAKSIYHYHIWKIETKQQLDKTFAYYLLQSITREIKNASRGASMLHMTKSGMEAWPIKLPPMEEQKEFAAFVSKLDSIHDAMEKSQSKIIDKSKSLQHQAFTTGFDA